MQDRTFLILSLRRSPAFNQDPQIESDRYKAQFVKISVIPGRLRIPSLTTRPPRFLTHNLSFLLYIRHRNLHKSPAGALHVLLLIMSGTPYLVEAYTSTQATGGDSLTEDLNVYYQSGDIAFMIICTALVLLMIPGVGFVISIQMKKDGSR